jgi:hypothetical protein
MQARADLHRAFAERFHAGKRLRPATVEQLADAEAALGVLWPESYRQFALMCGAVYTPSLLDLVVERRPGFSDVSQFLTPKQCVTETRRWRLDGVAFASDSSGSFFAFRHLTGSRPDDAAVWLFDHDEVVEQPSFDEWLGRFLQL